MSSDLRPLAIDLFTGLHGWTDGLVGAGWRVIGFDLEDMSAKFGCEKPPHFHLVLQDVLTLHGSQFRSADLIVCSPPCQFFSYTAMPWSRAKRLAEDVRVSPARLEKELALFRACFRIQQEACAAAGRHIPMIVENVRGAQPWVGRARWMYGSFALWGDVPALMPMTLAAQKNPGFRFDGSGRSFQSESVNQHVRDGFKSAGMNWSDKTKRGQDFTRVAGRQALEGTKVASTSGRSPSPGNGARFTSRDCGVEGHKGGGDWFGSGENCSVQRRAASGSTARKAASALIAKIPPALALHIARTFKPK